MNGKTVIIQGRPDREHLRAERVSGGWMFITQFPQEDSGDPRRPRGPREHHHFVLTDLQVRALAQWSIWGGCK